MAASTRPVSPTGSWRDNEMRENGVRFSGGAHRVGEQFGTGGVEGEQGGADEEEEAETGT
jgi:hypothetical protein